MDEDVQDWINDINKNFENIDNVVDKIIDCIDSLIPNAESKVQTLLQALKTNLLAWHKNEVENAYSAFDNLSDWYEEDTRTKWDDDWDEGWESYSRD